jgi:hypothetical protein
MFHVHLFQALLRYLLQTWPNIRNLNLIHFSVKYVEDMSAQCGQISGR